MTSINAIKFNHYQGAMVCDEQRGWNEENMAILTADKIKAVSSHATESKFRFAASYGNTGTSSIGDELKFKIAQAVQQRYQQIIKQKGEQVDSFMTMEELANIAFAIQTDLKHRHIDETLRGRYGFTRNDFLAGSYVKNGTKIEINQKEIVNKVHADLIWKDRKGEMTSIFLNAGIIAGYEPTEGFRIFHLSLIEYLCEPVQEIFLNDGSGRDVAMIYMTDFVNNVSIPERNGDIDPVDGLFSMINAVNGATRFNIGVGGYFNLILFDGHARQGSDIRREISDYRSKLASHIVNASYFGLLQEKYAKELLDQLCFGQEDFDQVFERMMSKADNPRGLSRLMRGYKTFHS
ncbi:hypothetical protein JXQ70_13580 [bacterium]|nr:hypothetical protein [bacterium]